MAKRIIIIPGFSSKNKEWVDETAKQLKDTFTIDAVYWNHWEEEKKDNWIDDELKKIKTIIGSDTVNIIAKSIGTYIISKFLKSNKEHVNKLILCGICLNDLDENDKMAFDVLRQINPGKILCIQNQEDHHGSFEQVREFVGKINSDIKVISKPGDTHEYPYSEDFQEFFTS